MRMTRAVEQCKKYNEKCFVCEDVRQEFLRAECHF